MAVPVGNLRSEILVVQSAQNSGPRVMPSAAILVSDQRGFKSLQSNSLRNCWRPGFPDQSGLMLAARTTLPHFLRSATSLAKLVGEPGSAMTPNPGKPCLRLGSARATLISC